MRYFFLLSLLILSCPSILFPQSKTDIRVGVEAFQAQQFEECLLQMAKIIEADSLLPEPDQAVAHFYLAQSYLALSNSPDLRTKYPNAVLESYNHLTAARDLDPIAYRSSSRPSSRILWQKFLQEIRTAIHIQDWQRAATFVDRAVLIRGNDPQINYYRGLSLMQRGFKERALQSWQIARKYASEDSEVWTKTSLQMVRSLVKDQNYEAALNFLPEESRNRDLVLERFAVLSQVPNGVQQANAYFQQLRQWWPGNPFPQYGLAHFYHQAGKTGQAITAANSNLKLYPGDRDSHQLLANIFLAQARDWQENEQTATQIEASLQRAEPHLLFLSEQEPENDRWKKHLYNLYQWLNSPEQMKYKPGKG